MSIKTINPAFWVSEDKIKTVVSVLKPLTMEAYEPLVNSKDRYLIIPVYVGESTVEFNGQILSTLSNVFKEQYLSKYASMDLPDWCFVVITDSKKRAFTGTLRQLTPVIEPLKDAMVPLCSLALDKPSILINCTGKDISVIVPNLSTDKVVILKLMDRIPDSVHAIPMYNADDYIQLLITTDTGVVEEVFMAGYMTTLGRRLLESEHLLPMKEISDLVTEDEKLYTQSLHLPTMYTIEALDELEDIVQDFSRVFSKHGTITAHGRPGEQLELHMSFVKPG